MTTTLQTNRSYSEPVAAPAPEGIEWAGAPVQAPADERLDPRPTPEQSGLRLSTVAAIGTLRRSMSARRARRIAGRPELESVFPPGHPGFELRASANRALATATRKDDGHPVDLDFAF